MTIDLNSMTVIDRLGANSVLDPNALRGAAAAKDPKQRAELLAGQLESIFFGMMMKAMRATVPEGGLLGKGLGGKTYVEMLDQQLTQLGDLPRDPRFHEALVRQIMRNPDQTSKALEKV